MTIGLRVPTAVLGVAAVLVLAGCAGPTGPAADQPAPPASPASDVAGPTPGADGDCDPAGAPSRLACVVFASTSGTQGGEPVGWLATDPIRLQLVPLGDTPALVVGAGCNTLDVPVSVTALGLLPDTDRIATTLALCLGDAADHEAWTTEVVSRPMAYRLRGTTLTLTSDDTRIVFERAE